MPKRILRLLFFILTLTWDQHFAFANLSLLYEKVKRKNMTELVGYVADVVFFSFINRFCSKRFSHQ